MELIQAAILGIIEGITEFLPISSTGHLIVSERLLGFSDTTKLFTVIIQFGAILAAAWFFRADLAKIICGLIAREARYTRFLGNLLLGLIPAAGLGALIELTVGIPDSLWLIAMMLVLGGIGFLVIEKIYSTSTPTVHDITAITRRRSLLIGFGQCLSLIPGVSRSGATIMTGLLSGLDRKTATIFSFYLSIPIMLGASALKLADDYSLISTVTGGSRAIFVGLICAFIAAIIAVKWLLRYVSGNTFKPFAYYRIVAGITLLALLTFKVL